MPRLVSALLHFGQRLFQALLQRLPHSIRERIDDAVHDLTAHFVTTSLQITGPLAGSVISLSCLLLGQPMHSRHFLLRAFPHNSPRGHEVKLLRSSLKSLLENPPPDTDLMIFRVPNHRLPSIEGLYDFRGRSHVKQVVDISGTWEEIRHRWHSNAKDTERKIRKFGFSPYVSRSLQDFHLFYHKMYVPHVQQQFGALADILPYENLLQKFNHGFLLFLNYREHQIAATLCETEGDILTYRCMGMPTIAAPEVDAARHAARAALYYFMLRLAKDWDMKQVDLLNSLALLHDGVYVHKRKWGSVVLEEKAQTTVCFRILRHNEAVIRFFELNPAIVTTAVGLQGLIGWRTPHPPSDSQKAELFHKYYAPGLAGLLLLTPGSPTPIEVAFLPDAATRHPPAASAAADTTTAASSSSHI